MDLDANASSLICLGTLSWDDLHKFNTTPCPSYFVEEMGKAQIDWPLIPLSSGIFIGGHGDYKLNSFHHTKSYSIFSTTGGKTLGKTNLGKKIYFS
jgi:hypothetical protein